MPEESQTSKPGEEAASEAAGYVYVCGAVEQPGVYGIYEGMRIFEVVALAGGMTEDADTVWINQAQQVTDGQQIQIYTKEETAQMRSSGMTGGSDNGNTGQTGDTSEGSADGKVNINTADREELMTLPGIGVAKADAIIQYREEHGSFASIEDICLISGIKEAVFSNIRDRITV
jgi:competence protein ComEA